MKNVLKIAILAILLVQCSEKDNNTKNIIEKPLAVDDSYATDKNKAFMIASLLNNDTTQEATKITSFDETTSKSGSVNKNKNGTFTYTPAINFFGDDSFTYTICNGTNACSTATVTITVKNTASDDSGDDDNGDTNGDDNGDDNSTGTPVTFNIPSNIADYYNNLGFTDSKSNNKSNLKAIISNNKKSLTYGQRHNFLYDADRDLTSKDDVVLIYTGEKRYWEEYTSGNNSYSTQTYNAEHIYPQSLLKKEKIYDLARADLHHLRVCDAGVNSTRGNNAYTDGEGDYKSISGKWYPGDQWKGDVARMILYLNVIYNANIDNVGNLELFLKWNIEDPVSEFENQRNNVIYGAQNNRNPFIDNPYLATLIYGGSNAENKWK